MYLVIQRTELGASHIRGLRLPPRSLTPHTDFKSIELPSHSRGKSTGVPWIRIPGTSLWIQFSIYSGLGSYICE